MLKIPAWTGACGRKVTQDQGPILEDGMQGGPPGLLLVKLHLVGPQKLMGLRLQEKHTVLGPGYRVGFHRMQFCPVPGIWEPCKS